MHISDFIQFYNNAQEGLYGASKSDRVAYDFYAALPGMKPAFLKYCKPFEPRLRSLVEFHRVTAVNEEEPTQISVAGFITEWKAGSKGKNKLNPMKVEMQFLEHHKMQYLDLHRELMKIDYVPQS